MNRKFNKTATGRRRKDESPEDTLSGDSFAEREAQKRVFAWVPKTDLGRAVKNGEIDSLDQVFDLGHTITEPEIVDVLMPQQLEKMVELKKTARVISAGRMFSYRATVLIGNGNGFVGVGNGSDKERQPAIAKAASRAKQNLVRVHRGCGSWECVCGLNHSIPFETEGRCGSVRMLLKPAPKGIGLVVGERAKDVLRFAGIKDAWSMTTGRSRTTLNFIKACVNALSRGSNMRMSDELRTKIERRSMKQEESQ